MATQRRWTKVLPVAILAAGLLVPLLIERGDAEQAGDRSTATWNGRSAAEWAALATRALERGSFDRALAYIKRAERVEPGVQFASELDRIRRERWRSREIASLRERFLAGEPAELEFDAAGAVSSAWRVTLALPGESLWSLAVAAAAAEERVLPTEDPSSGVVYAWWDALTELNGLRELEVGDEVLVPLPSSEVASLEKALAARVERERSLVAQAHELAARADSLDRIADYGDYVTSLRAARGALLEAESLSEGERYASALASVETLLAEAKRVEVRGDRTVAVRRVPGEAFTAAALDAVEWLLERQLRRGDAEFPDVEGKTPDQIAWAKFLVAASALAGERGLDMETVIASADGGEILLPDPSAYFQE